MEHHLPSPQQGDQAALPQIVPGLTVARHQLRDDPRHHKVGGHPAGNAHNGGQHTGKVLALLAAGLSQQPRQSRCARSFFWFAHMIPSFRMEMPEISLC